MRTIIRQRHNQSGQATLEMILLLVVGVLVTLGLVYRFNTAFKKYTTDMYGSYYRCLLETGELPGTGSTCNSKEARFAIANGKALVKDKGGSPQKGLGATNMNGGGSGQTNMNGGGSGQTSMNGGGNGKTNMNGKGSSGGRGSGGSGGSGSGNGGSGGETTSGGGQGSGGGRSSTIAKLRGMQKTRSTAVGSSVGADDKNGADAKPAPISAARSSHSSSDGLRGAKTKMDFKMDGGEYTRSETSSVTPTTASAKATKSVGAAGDSLRPRKAEEKGERAPSSKMKSDDSGGMDFGKLFRMFLIFAIIVGIVIFLGGQVLQISKGGEK